MPKSNNCSIALLAEAVGPAQAVERPGAGPNGILPSSIEVARMEHAIAWRLRPRAPSRLHRFVPMMEKAQEERSEPV
jgi:hypothetical protein